MINTQNPKFQELVAKLSEIFQINRAELDFGIYRILNARAAEINNYLQNQLVEKVQAALSAGIAASSQQLQAELQEAEKNAQDLGVIPDAVPRVQELREKLKKIQADSFEHENAVFSHLLTFFSRYYQAGDFISQRRYKGDIYAIPYAGEEVVLHWANKDQYYTKSGENFSNYRFKLEDGRSVFFRLVAADTAKDNRKDNNTDRRFSLINKKTVTRVDKNGEEYEEELLPVEEVTVADGSTELVIRFEYSAQPKGTKQETLVTMAVEAVLADVAVKARWRALSELAPTEKNPKRTLLEKHLSDYTTKNTADYFIHKDLGGFLRRELDFYIKNEVMHLDDVQNASAFADIEKNLRMIQCLRSIALDLMSFLAQLEDFQKKLWLKKKFVVEARYCLTLDRVPKTLYPEIAANEAQREEWVKLYAINEIEGDLAHPGYSVPLTVDFLEANQYLMVDTRHFDREFTLKLLACMENMDASLDGVCINSENFQALNLVLDRYRGQVQCIYIDPPYNTGSDNDFAYKDNYRHSSWLSMMFDRTALSRALANTSGAIFVSTDDGEYANLRLVLDESWGGNNFVADVIWSSRKSVSNDALISVATNHVTCYAVSKVELENRKESFRLPQNEKGFENPDNDPRGPWKLDPMDAPNIRENLTYPIKNPATEEEFYPPEGRCWRFEQWQTEQLLQEGRIVFGRSGTAKPMYRRYLSEAKAKGKTPTTLWDDVKTTTDATKLLLDLFGAAITRELINKIKPKPTELVERCVRLLTDSSGIILDYFAGSGTAAHAVVNLNRQDGGKRKYLLVEMGEYVETVLVPRLKKVVYSSDWKEGKPQNRDTGVSHCFKVLKLESYEDTLNNLQLLRTDEQSKLLNTLPQDGRDDYLLHYMLAVESRGSLLSVEDFKEPFDYTLNIAVDSAGAFEARKIDLVETFNYLIGLRVNRIDSQPERGFATVVGTLPSGESCLVLWRDCKNLDYDGIAELWEELNSNPADNMFEVLYINGDHNIPTVLTQTAEKGGATHVFKLRQIEPEFLERMFSVVGI